MKKVDYKILVKSGIDFDFSDDAEFNRTKAIGFLNKIDDYSSECIFQDERSMTWKYARPRMNHWHVWQGGECPLPEGFKVKIMFRDGSLDNHDHCYHNKYWYHEEESDIYDLMHDEDTMGMERILGQIIAFKVIGLANGYCWPWEDK